MEERVLGKTGLRVSALGYGAGAVGGLLVKGDAEEQRRTVARAIEAGITYFDTAPGYGDGRSEENLGRVLRELGAWGKVVVGTKVRLGVEELADPVGAIRRSCEASLRRLGHDSVDLIQLHNQVQTSASGGGVPLDEVLGGAAAGFQALQRDGLVRHIGITGMGETAAVQQVVRDGRYATVQTYFNALYPSAGIAGAAGGGQDFAGLIDVAAGQDVGVIVIRPMAAGALVAETARHANAGDTGGPMAGGAGYARDVARAQALAPLVAEFGLESPLELSLRFVMAKAGVSTVIVGYSDQAQLEDALRWTARGPLPSEAVERVIALARSEGGTA